MNRVIMEWGWYFREEEEAKIAVVKGSYLGIEEIRKWEMFEHPADKFPLILNHNFQRAETRNPFSYFLLKYSWTQREEMKKL